MNGVRSQETSAYDRALWVSICDGQLAGSAAREHGPVSREECARASYPISRLYWAAIDQREAQQDHHTDRHHGGVTP